MRPREIGFVVVVPGIKFLIKLLQYRNPVLEISENPALCMIACCPVININLEMMI